MAVNALRKDLPRGTKPPSTASSNDSSWERKSQEDKELERDLAAQEEQDVWESEEIGIVKWSEGGGSRFSDPGAD